MADQPRRITIDTKAYAGTSIAIIPVIVYAESQEAASPLLDKAIEACVAAIEPLEHTELASGPQHHEALRYALQTTLNVHDALAAAAQINAARRAARQ